MSSSDQGGKLGDGALWVYRSHAIQLPASDNFGVKLNFGSEPPAGRITPMEELAEVALPEEEQRRRQEEREEKQRKREEWLKKREAAVSVRMTLLGRYTAAIPSDDEEP